MRNCTDRRSQGMERTRKKRKAGYGQEKQKEEEEKVVVVVGVQIGVMLLLLCFEGFSSNIRKQLSRKAGAFKRWKGITLQWKKKFLEYLRLRQNLGCLSKNYSIKYYLFPYVTSLSWQAAFSLDKRSHLSNYVHLLGTDKFLSDTFTWWWRLSWVEQTLDNKNSHNLSIWWYLPDPLMPLL